MRVGICVREYDKKGKYSCFDKCIGVPKAFIDICQNFNVTPILLTMGCGLRELTELTDGLIVPGSALSMSDLREYPVDKEVINLYLGKKPIFGICGGMQELCVAMGHKVIEYDTKGHMGTRHKVSLNGDFYTKIFGKRTITVNSYHNHRCQINCSNTAVSLLDDLVIEGFMEDKNLGVQWHPEVMKREHCDKIFGYFFGMCLENGCKN